MSKFIQLNKRNGETKSQLNQARKQGRIPAVLYGVDKDTLSLEVSEKEIHEILKKNPHAILQGKTADDNVVPIVIQNIQRDSMSRKLLHIDFHHVNMTENMDSKVTIHFTGDPIGLQSGGVIQVELYEVEIRCMPKDLPSSLEVDISGLDCGDQLLVSDLAFKDGIEVLSDPNTLMIKVNAVHAEAAGA